MVIYATEADFAALLAVLAEPPAPHAALVALMSDAETLAVAEDALTRLSERTNEDVNRWAENLARDLVAFTD